MNAFIFLWLVVLLVRTIGVPARTITTTHGTRTSTWQPEQFTPLNHDLNHKIFNGESNKNNINYVRAVRDFKQTIFSENLSVSVKT
jgi:hypothetical protein